MLVVAVTTGEQPMSFVNKYVVVNGVTGVRKYFLLELAAVHWMRQVQKRTFRRRISRGSTDPRIARGSSSRCS